MSERMLGMEEKWVEKDLTFMVRDFDVVVMLCLVESLETLHERER